MAMKNFIQFNLLNFPFAFSFSTTEMTYLDINMDGNFIFCKTFKNLTIYSPSYSIIWIVFNLRTISFETSSLLEYILYLSYSEMVYRKRVNYLCVRLCIYFEMVETRSSSYIELNIFY